MPTSRAGASPSGRTTCRSCSIRVGLNARYLYDDNLGGFNRYTVCLIKALQHVGGVELTLFTDPRWPLHPSFSHLLGAHTRLAAPRSSRALLWEQVALPAALRREKIDVFHAPADGGLPAWKNCRQALTYHRALDRSMRYWMARGDLPRTPETFGLRTGVGTFHRRVRHSALRRMYLHCADKVIAVSHFGKWELVTLLGVPEEKVEVIPLAAESSFSPEIRSEQVESVRMKYRLPQRYLLYVGGLNPWKNVDGLIRAFANARRAGIDQSLVIAGSGPRLPELRLLARQLGLSDEQDVLFLGSLQSELPALYHGATAFITLSWGESFPLPVIEAMSCGTPIIASRLGGTPELVGDAGLLVDPRAADDVLAAIDQITRDPECCTTMRARSLMRASSFSWQKTAQQTVQLYRSLTASESWNAA